MADRDDTRRSLADKLEHLFRETRPARGEYSNEHVAKAIEEAGGPTISATYVWQLRKGIRDNPTKKHLEALAGFFGVPVAYFFDDEVAATIDAELAVLSAMRDPAVRRLALRAQDLSVASLEAISQMIEQVRKLEGLPDAPPGT